MGKNKLITVHNTEGEPDTKAEIIIQNKIKYTPKVSVIIPVYNVEQYLRECLDSVVHQTLKEIEIICVDDGSTDKSLDILKEYAAKDNRITILKQQNLHAGVARNAGLAVAKGEYLSFLDSDDFFELNMLEETYKYSQGKNIDICIFGCSFYDNQTKLKSSPSWILREDCLPQQEVFTPKEVADHLFQITNNWPWNKLFRHKYIAQNKLFFQSISHTNDTYFVCLALSLARRISVLKQKYVNYRMNVSKSLTTTGVREKSPLDIDAVLYALHLKLKPSFRKSFSFLVCNHLYWNLKHITTDFKKNLLLEAIITHDFYGIPLDLTVDYFDDRGLFDKYNYLVNLMPQRLREKREILRQIDVCKVISFDIFDTTIVRPYYKPSDLFRHLGQMINDDEFYTRRIEAEVMARKNAKYEEITLKEIYSYLPDRYARVKEQEEKLELQVARENQYIIDIIKYAYDKGKKVIFTSDMYLDERVIISILKKIGLDKYDLYLSSKIKKTKASGALYQYVLQCLRIKAQDMLHIGDNAYSDKKIPHSLGINAVQIKQYNNISEHPFLKRFYNEKNLNRSIISSLSMFNSYKSKNYWYNIGYALGGPLANFYAGFINNVCKENKLQELLFIARDGYVLEKVYKILYKKTLPSHYIYASRGLIHNTLHDTNTAREYDKYLQSEQIQHKNLGMIDTTTMNMSAQKFLTDKLPDKKIMGIYWLANKDVVGYDYKYVFSRPHRVEDINFLIETLLTAPHGAVNCIKECQPIYDEDSILEQRRCAIYSEVASGIVQYNKDIKDIFSQKMVTSSPTDIVDLLYSFLYTHSIQDLKYFTELSHSGNLHNSDNKSLDIYLQRFKTSEIKNVKLSIKSKHILKKYFLFNFIPLLKIEEQ